MRQARNPNNGNLFALHDFIAEGYPEVRPYHSTKLGALFEGDCLTVLPTLKSESVDTVFADPPFNLGKEYGNKTTDRIPEDQYIPWCEQWINECIRILKPGGALFLYNLPKWNVLLGNFLAEAGMEFQHWIAIEISPGLPPPNGLYPSHYSLLYYTKGKPKTFRRIRTPILTCRHCGKEIKDYGGHRGKMNPNGINLKDVWSDIPPVRHRKYKSENRKANALSTKLLDRVIEISTCKDDVVLDPFGGSGTTYVVCEKKGRKWIGTEIQSCDVIVERLNSKEIHQHNNDDFVDVDFVDVIQENHPPANLSLDLPDLT